LSSVSTTDATSPVLKCEAHKIQKDSCLDFKLGKDNVLTGKTDTVPETGRTKVSVFGKAMTPGRVSKISKFSSRPPV
jgi:hypothetical protein